MSIKLPDWVGIFLGQNLVALAVVPVSGGTALFSPILLTSLKLFFFVAFDVPIVNPFIGFAPKRIGVVSALLYRKSVER